MSIVPEGMVDAAGLAEAMAVSKFTVYNWVKQEKIPFQRNGPRSTFFDVEKVKAAIGENIVDATPTKRKLLGVLSADPKPKRTEFAPPPVPQEKADTAIGSILRAADECRKAGLHRSERKLLWLAVKRQGIQWQPRI